MKIGILALQGDFERHQIAFRDLGVETLQVRKIQELDQCQGLVIPGGESTTLFKLLNETNLYPVLPKFAAKYPIFGTCAGLILLSANVINRPVEPLGLIDITVHRNAYGRQIDSFIDTVDLELSGKSYKVEGVFIRAPKITRAGEGVNILGRHENEVVVVEEDRILASTFHPELTNSKVIHKYFVGMVSKFWGQA